MGLIGRVKMAISRLKAISAITEQARTCIICGTNPLRSTSLGVTIFTCEHTTGKVMEALKSAGVESTNSAGSLWVKVDAVTAQSVAVR